MTAIVKGKSAYNRVVNSWALYHWADNAFAATIVAAILPIYYSKVAASGLPAYKATAYWGYTNAAAVLIPALLAPVLGTLANILGLRKRFLLITAALGIFFTATLYFITTGDWFMASLIYIVSHTGFTLADVFHNALLPHVAKEGDMDKVSSRGYAIGYLGGGILLGINVAMLKFMPDKGLAARLSFVSASLWWAVFTIPLVLNVNEPAQREQPAAGVSPLAEGYKLLADTYSNIKRYRELVIFLVAFLVYNDGIGTIIKVATIYGSELGLGTNTLIGALLMTQFVGIPFTLAFGGLAKRISAKTCIYIGLAVYILISIGGYFITRPIDFWILAFMVGMVQGGTQALSRSLFGSMTPKEKSSEFFGFYGISARIGGFIGPLLFGLISQFTANSRYSVFSLVIFFIIGAIILTRVDVDKGIRVAREEDTHT